MSLGGEIVGPFEVAGRGSTARLRNVRADLGHDLFLVVRQTAIQAAQGFLRGLEQLGRGLLLLVQLRTGNIGGNRGVGGGASAAGFDGGWDAAMEVVFPAALLAVPDAAPPAGALCALA